jgi:hypothetical protein
MQGGVMKLTQKGLRIGNAGILGSQVALGDQRYVLNQKISVVFPDQSRR